MNPSPILQSSLAKFSHIKFHEGDRVGDIYLPGNLHIQTKVCSKVLAFLKVGYVTVSSECVYIYMYNVKINVDPSTFSKKE